MPMYYNSTYSIHLQKSGLPGTVGISPREEWSSWNCCMVAHLEKEWYMVFLELLRPHLERVVFLELLVLISLLRIVVILELLVGI